MAVTITRFEPPPGTALEDICAVWGRVSTEEQATENQIPGLTAWAGRKGLFVAAIFAVEDSASKEGKANGKGLEFEKAREELIKGAHLGFYSKVLVQHTWRMTRRGMEDMLNVVRRLAEAGADTWSADEPYLETADARTRQLLLGLSGWSGEGDSEERSKAIKRGLARRRADLEAGIPVKGRQALGGRVRGSRNRNPAPQSKRDAVSASWTPERRQALAARNRSRAGSES